MEAQSTFDKLVENLSKEERSNLLDQLQSGEESIVNVDPLRESSDEQRLVNYDQAYEELNFFERMILFLKVLFTSTTREELLEQFMLTKLGKGIERQHPDLYDYSENRILGGFAQNVRKMKDTLAFLHEPYSEAFGRNKQDFFAFLVGWRFPDIQQRLLHEIEPEQVAFEKSLEEPKDIKREIENRLEDILEGVGQEQRELLYREARRFNTLYHLVFFAFERILSEFDYDNVKKRYQTRLGDVREPLNDLAQILMGLEEPPSEEMIKVLFIFYLKKELETESTEDIDSHLKKLLSQANQAFSHIRFFNRRVPLMSLIRLSKRNLEYVPPEIGGGEDWYVLFKQFWYRRFDEKIKAYTRQYKRKKLIEEAENFLTEGELEYIPGYGHDLWGEELTPRYINSIALVKGFVKGRYFKEMHGPLKLVLIDGKFYKEQNRDEYNDAYNAIFKVYEELNTLEQDLASDGEIGKKIESINSEADSQWNRLQKLKKVLEETDKRVEQMISRTIENLTLTTNIIGGIIHGDVGGRYDTLSNLGYIGRNENKNLPQKLNTIKEEMEEFVRILSSLYDTERQ